MTDATIITAVLTFAGVLVQVIFNQIGAERARKLEYDLKRRELELRYNVDLDDEDEEDSHGESE